MIALAGLLLGWSLLPDGSLQYCWTTWDEATRSHTVQCRVLMVER